MKRASCYFSSHISVVPQPHTRIWKENDDGCTCLRRLDLGPFDFRVVILAIGVRGPVLNTESVFQQKFHNGSTKNKARRRDMRRGDAALSVRPISRRRLVFHTSILDFFLENRQPF